MDEIGWIGLSRAEAELLTEALAGLRPGKRSRDSEINQLAKRLHAAASSPEITIGVFGGVVQWTQGNPFPIRIVDYDGGEAELPDRDDEGHPCVIWTEPPDPRLAATGA